MPRSDWPSVAASWVVLARSSSASRLLRPRPLGLQPDRRGHPDRRARRGGVLLAAVPVRWLLLAAGGALARFGLTEREREILALLAAGRSNPQIAGALFISPKTASVHVSNILAKLGVASRVEAAAVAHRLGVTG